MKEWLMSLSRWSTTTSVLERTHKLPCSSTLREVCIIIAYMYATYMGDDPLPVPSTPACVMTLYLQFPEANPEKLNNQFKNKFFYFKVCICMAGLRIVQVLNH